MGLENKCNQDIWYAEANKYKNVADSLGSYIPQDKLIGNEWKLHSANWYRFNAPESTGIKTYFDFLEWLGYIKQQPKTKEDTIYIIYQMQEKLERPIIGTDFKNAKLGEVNYTTIMKFWNGINDMQKELGLKETHTFDGLVFNKESIILKIKEFYKEFNRIPTAKDFGNKTITKLGYPSRKTVEKYFGNFRNAIVDAGYIYDDNKQIVDDKLISIYNNKEILVNIIYEFIGKYNKVPTCKELWKECAIDLKYYYKEYFGSWNNCLKSLGLKLNSVTQYTDEELKDAFINFVNKYNRVPAIRDFNGTGRPSFWVYQNRFGSWAEACIHYGYKPNCRENEYYMNDGEVCDSSFEYDISFWLKNNNIKYERNIPYIDFISNYNGKMNCDYKFILDNNQIWYVEMAGFIHTYDFKKLKQRPEQVYYFKLKYKEKLLKREKCNYLIISVDDMKHKSLAEIFYFLNIQEKEAV